ASQKLYRAPCRPIKASGLTWASVPAARSRRRRGSSELGHSSAGGPPTQRHFEATLGSRHTHVCRLLGVALCTRGRSPRRPGGGPIKPSEVGNSDARKHRGILLEEGPKDCAC